MRHSQTLSLCMSSHGDHHIQRTLVLDKGVTHNTAFIGRMMRPRGELLIVIGGHENQRLCGNFVRLTCLAVGP